ncbi:hypothetical protein GNY06_10295 [Elizabethkingia argentiflava]|uniref:Uncharacterized protein n=1 Tax=Elizabethkingia argenteiflava TaxID=2681556 RepID=A0A845PY42_9FLAO|nr:hypothetical protein [Elizabethkingia argenteiflava]NAW51746.1 hypothetical protein [Elizabethkingia argenteiflava]
MMTACLKKDWAISTMATEPSISVGETGRSNYTQLAQSTGIDVVSQP